MNKELRKKIVIAMEMLVRSVNNEYNIDGWLMCGVADGDIKRYEPDEVDDYYIEDKEFSELMDLFLRTMTKANANGGLIVDGVVSKRR